MMMGSVGSQWNLRRRNTLGWHCLTVLMVVVAATAPPVICGIQWVMRRLRRLRLLGRLIDVSLLLLDGRYITGSISAPSLVADLVEPAHYKSGQVLGYLASKRLPQASHSSADPESGAAVAT